MTGTTLIILVVGAGAIFLATQRWFWLALFGLATLASGFTVIASVIRFAIFQAVGFTALTGVLYTITVLIWASGPNQRP